tara:strand:+ start:1020 stop:1178 length:159 start_codon:yes stop_codon:yes gene_type:complete
MKTIKHKAILTIHGADKMNNREIKTIQNWLTKISKNLPTEAFAKRVSFRLMK